MEVYPLGSGYRRYSEPIYKPFTHERHKKSWLTRPYR